MSAVSNRVTPASTAASRVASISRIGTVLLIDPTRPHPIPSTETLTPPLNDRYCIIRSPPLSTLMTPPSPRLFGHHLSDKIRRPFLSRPLRLNPSQSVTVCPHTKRAGSLGRATRYVLPSNRLLPSVMIAKFSLSGLVSETPPAQAGPSNVIALPRMVLL